MLSVIEKSVIKLVAGGLTSRVASKVIKATLEAAPSTNIVGRLMDKVGASLIAGAIANKVADYTVMEIDEALTMTMSFIKKVEELKKNVEAVNQEEFVNDDQENR